MAHVPGREGAAFLPVVSGMPLYGRGRCRDAVHALQRQQLRQQGQVEQQQLQGCGRLGILHDAALGVQYHLPGRVQVTGGETRGQALPEKDLLAGQAQSGRHGLAALPQQEQVAQMSGQLAHEKSDVHPLAEQAGAQLGDGGAVPGMEGVEEVGEQFLSGQSQHFAGHGAGEVVAAQGQGLVQKGHAVAHAARGPARDEAHGAFLEGDVLLVQDLGKVLYEGVLAQMAEDEMLAAADDGDGELVRLGGGEDEDHARGRLLQRLEQGIEGAAREHVGFVDDEDLVAALHGGVADVLAQGAGVFHTVVGGAVDLGDVHMAALGDLAALVALVAGLGARRMAAVEGLGEDAGDGGLAHAARAAEQIGGGDPVFGGGTGEHGLDHVLSGDLGKGLGAVFCGEGEVLHEKNGRARLSP